MIVQAHHSFCKPFENRRANAIRAAATKELATNYELSRVEASRVTVMLRTPPNYVLKDRRIRARPTLQCT
uniref:Uncharacterized protein n=1 Tax=Fervidicoccus fontis TaxID=683846 RepID=A0A7J3ZLS5_9CREN